MVEPVTILDKMGILDPIERLRLLELMEVVLLALAMRGAGATESIQALNIVGEIVELELKAATFNERPTPTRVM